MAQTTMARRAIAVNDDNGMYRVQLGARPLTWETMRRTLEEEYAYEAEDASRFDVEPLMGWEPWTWAILANGEAVAFVDGAEEPTDLPYAAR